MRFFRDVSISIKVLIPPVILVVALGMLSGFSIFRLNEQRLALTKINDIVLKKITLIDEFILLSEQVQSDVYQICVLKFMGVYEPEIVESYQRLEQGLHDINVIYGEILTQWELDEEERRLLELIKIPMNIYRQQAGQAVQSMLDNPSFGIFLVRSSIIPFTEFQSILGDFLDYQKLMIIKVEDTANENVIMVSMIISIVSILVMLSGISAILLISTRLISRPILLLAKYMHKLAMGDLSVEVKGLERQDEIGSIVRALLVFKKNSVDKAMLDKALKQNMRNLELINRANNAFSSTLDLEEVLDIVMREVQHMFSVITVSIWFIDFDLSELVCSRAIGSKSEMVHGMRLPLGQGIIGSTVVSNESRLVNDIYEDSYFDIKLKSKIIIDARSLLLVPIRVKENAIGILVAGDSKVARFDFTDLTLLESLTATASITIENARLYKQAKQDAETRDVLLREVNHRVKNNLAAIIGLLYTEKRYNKKKNKHDYPGFLDDLIQRVGGLASVHKLLSASEWTRLHLNTLLDHIINSSLKMLTPHRHISVEINALNILITPDQAHNLSIVINELMTNTIKHGIHDSNTAQIIVSAHVENKMVILEFCDSGPGYPEDVLQLNHYNMGFDLIKNIVKKNLRGELFLYNNPGAVAIIKFRMDTKEG